MKALIIMGFISCLFYASHLIAQDNETETNRNDKVHGPAPYVNIGTQFSVVVGDITTQTFKDPTKAAIVNAANQILLGGGGIDYAIHKAAGPGLKAECAKLPLLGPNSRCKVGQAVLTSGHNLGLVRIIHTVGPNVSDYQAPLLEHQEQLANAYRNVLEIAHLHDIREIVFPPISTGIYGYDPELATPIAVQAVMDYWYRAPKAFDEIRFIIWDQDPKKEMMMKLYQAALKNVKPTA